MYVVSIQKVSLNTVYIYINGDHSTKTECFIEVPSLRPTFVSAQAVMLNLRNRRTRAILISSWASLIPTQLRGPAPNGRYTKGCLLALASGVNLKIKHVHDISLRIEANEQMQVNHEKLLKHTELSVLLLV